MIAKNHRNANLGIGLGIVMCAIGGVLTRNQAGASLAAGAVLYLAGDVLFLWGCANFSVGKGYSRWLGALGLLSCIGLIVIAVLEDKCPDGLPKQALGPLPTAVAPGERGILPPPPTDPTS